MAIKASIREFLGMMELFCTLMMVVVYICVKIHRVVHEIEKDFVCQFRR